jgi:hypothetical protein
VAEDSEERRARKQRQRSARLGQAEGGFHIRSRKRKAVIGVRDERAVFRKQESNVLWLKARIILEQ